MLSLLLSSTHGLSDSHQIENRDLDSLLIPIELHQRIFYLFYGDLEGARTLDLQRDRLAF